MPVFRVEKNKNYTTMSNFHLKDRELSLKAKGLLSIMLSLPDDWDFTQAGLVTLSRDGMDSLRSTLSELEKHGYLVRTKILNEKGQFSDIEYCVFEHPIEVQKDEKKRDTEKKKKRKTVATSKAKDVLNPESGKSKPVEEVMEEPPLENPRAGRPTLEPPILENPTLVGTVLGSPESDNPTLGCPVQRNPESENPISGNPLSENRTQLNTKYNKKLTGLNTYPSVPFADATASAEAKEKKRYSEDPQEQLLLSIYGLEDQEMAINIAEKKLKERLEYEALVHDYPGEKPVIDAIISIMVTEVFTTRRKQMRIASDMRHLNIVRKRFLKLNCFHLQKIIENLDKLEKDPVNDKQYILACLYNAPDTMPLQTKTEFAEWVNTKNERSDAVESCGTDWETYQGSCVQ
ncbi:MAG: helix-turn-helix domain-containing protein [Lachnospiraceae bacterium]|nr:helix-turn-helix domain-containing protein [Lachnospiraceae bacterium]